MAPSEALIGLGSMSMLSAEEDIQDWVMRGLQQGRIPSGGGERVTSPALTAERRRLRVKTGRAKQTEKMEMEPARFSSLRIENKDEDGG